MLDSEKTPAQDTVGPSAGDLRRDERLERGEVPLALHEVLFSRTDERGVIKSGNGIFQRTSGFEWSSLIGAPHKIVRSPDTPKGVFWLLWDTIKKGHAMGAYVKNRSQDGGYYWVFAMIIPLECGYLSARMKPSSLVFRQIKQDYTRLIELEKDSSITPEESASRLLEIVAEHGFENYHQFEAHALAEELLARNAGLNQAPNPRILQLKSMLAAAQNLKTATDTLVSEFESVRIIPHNMRVIASRLEPAGGPFNTLSGNYGSMSSEMSDWFESNVVGEDSNFSTINESVNASMFSEGVVEILKDCDEQLISESEKFGEIDREGERAILKTIIQAYTSRSEDNQGAIYDEARRIQLACKTMTRHVLGLSTTRVMCKIESARMGLSGEGLTDIIGQLGRFQEKIGNQLSVVGKLSEEIRLAAENRKAGQ